MPLYPTISKTIVRFDLTKYKVREILLKIIKVIDFKVMVDFLIESYKLLLCYRARGMLYRWVGWGERSDRRNRLLQIR